MIFLCYPKCSTCMKAKKHLNQLGLSFEERDISRENPTAEELERDDRAQHLPVKNSSRRPAGVSVAAAEGKTAANERHEMIALLASDGMLVKRPLLIKEDKVLVGYQAEAYAALI